MCNFNREPFPSDVKGLLNESHRIAEKIAGLLNKPNCPKLNELFQFSNNKVNRNKTVFEEHGYPSIGQNFMGLYVFGECKNNQVTPVYVGITRNIFRRLNQHGWGKTHNQATLAYLMADIRFKNSFKVEGQPYAYTIASKAPRAEIGNNADVERAKSIVQNYKVAIYPIEDDYELYFHEVAVAGILKTYWNSFRTH